jgi:hypothetical protein
MSELARAAVGFAESFWRIAIGQVRASECALRGREVANILRGVVEM